jgi:methylmalonyl-CoA decarboxylase
MELLQKTVEKSVGTITPKNADQPGVELVLKTVEEGVGTITLNYAEKHNALNADLIASLSGALSEMIAGGARVVILRASRGVKVWSAGHDVRELPTNGRDPLTYNDPLRRVVREIQEAPLPVIAMVEGSVWGGACEMVMSCDIVIAAENSTFALTPAKLGVPYDIAGVLNFMQRAGLPIIKEMLFTAQPMSAVRALHVGLVNQVVPVAQLEAATALLAEQITRNSPLVVGLLKEELRVLSAATPLTPEGFERIQALRRRIYDSADYQEGIRSFFEKRAPRFVGK